MDTDERCALTVLDEYTLHYNATSNENRYRSVICPLVLDK